MRANACWERLSARAPSAVGPWAQSGVLPSARAAVPPESLVALSRGANAAVHPLGRYGNGDVAVPNIVAVPRRLRTVWRTPSST